jgi:alcohol dehydrogenase class IV
VAFEVFDAVRTNPDERQVDAAAQRYRDAGCDGVVGVGGGSAMDVAKCAATLVSNGACRDVGGIVEYEDGRRPVTEPPPPLVLVPTTAGTGSEVVSGAIITDSGRAFKMHVVAVPADAALCDASLTLTLPPEPTAAAGIDALAHAIGAYTSVERQPLADAYAVYAIRTIARWLPRAVADGSDLAARDEMMLGSLTSGISMKGGGAVDHAFAHAVNALFDVHHGVGVAMFLPAAMKFNRPHMPERFADIAAALGAPDAVTAVRELIAACPIPGPAALGITPADIPALTAKVLDDKFHLGLNPVPVTEADARNVLQSVIGKESVVGR